MTNEEEKNECIVCGASGKTYAMHFCDQNADGPWCAEHFIAATGCTEEAHGEGCLTLVYETSDGGKQ
jgi:hypothetical protein